MNSLFRYSTSFFVTLALLVVRAPAQVPSTISYQGRVQVAGTNFSGAGQFKFALVSSGTNLNRRATAAATLTSGFITGISVTDGGSGYLMEASVTISDPTGSGAVATAQVSGGAVTSITVQNAGSGYSAPAITVGPPTAGPAFATYWSNDGSSASGGEPATAITLPVAQGLVTVLLGDGTITNMSPIPLTALSRPDAHVRIWFNDGVQGFAQLTPDQPLASVAYAMVAAGVPEGSIGAASLADQSITTAKLASGAVTSAQIADGSITPGDVDSLSFATLFWKSDGNAGTVPGTHFLGTTDDQPLELRVNNMAALRLKYDGGGASTVIGGSGNAVGDGAGGSTIAGGYLNEIGADSYLSAIGGGNHNRFGIATRYSTIAGGSDNFMDFISDYSAIGGGKGNTVGFFSRGATVAGGWENAIGTNSFASTIAGGITNVIDNNAFNAFIGGGFSNKIRASTSAIAGGSRNDVGADAFSSVIGGGFNNNIGPDSPVSTIAGGNVNDIAANSALSTIGGGDNNDIGANSSAGVIAGGLRNNIGSDSIRSVISGGFSNSVAGNSPYAMIPGGDRNFATNRALAAGTRARAIHSGAFVWADAANADFISTATNQFAVRAGGGARFETGGAGMTVDGQAVLAGQLASSHIADGAITPTDLNVSSFSTVFWKADGNSGTVPGIHFLGTTDNQPIEFKVNGGRALRLEPQIFGPNVIAGASGVAAGNYAATIAGGAFNFIAGNGHRSTIGGGYENRIAADSTASTIAGGVFNDIGTNSFWSVIGGGTNNNIADTAPTSFIGGGQDNAIYSSLGHIGGGALNRVHGGGGSIGGGASNAIGTNSQLSAIGGGSNNRIGTNSSWSFIGAGGQNNIAANASWSVIGGGNGNIIGNNSSGAVIAGGIQNILSANTLSSAIGGGNGNLVSGASNAVVAGGAGNVIGVNSHLSSIGGGDANSVGNNSPGASIGGGTDNIVGLNSSYATIPGGDRNFATNRAFAAGTRAKANHTGSFVWADSANADFTSTGNDQFQVRAGGGVNIVSPTEMCTLRLTSIGGAPVSWGLSINQSIGSVMTISNGGQPRITMPANGNVGIGNTNPTARLQVINATCDGTTWINGSDRNIKTNFRPVDPLAVLEKVTSLPITRWAYRSTETEDHIGPVAQDFRAAFGLGAGDTGIATVDADGVALAAIQGLNQKLQEQSAQLKRKNAEISALEARLARLEQLLSSNAGSRN